MIFVVFSAAKGPFLFDYGTWMVRFPVRCHVAETTKAKTPNQNLRQFCAPSVRELGRGKQSCSPLLRCV